MNLVTQYERRFVDTNNYYNPLINTIEEGDKTGTGIRVVVDKMVLIRKQYGWYNGKWACTRISESDSARKSETNFMGSHELEGWGSVKAKVSQSGPSIREDLIRRGFIRTPSYSLLPYLALNADAVKSHMDDLERVSRGEEPTPCSGTTEDYPDEY